MDRYKRIIMGAVVAPLVISLCGCVMTVDQMYCLPRRSESFTNLQSAMETAMQDMSFCAPISGDNQQPVQMADLNGDGTEEVIVFAKGSQEKPLQIMVFSRDDEKYQLRTTIESTGTAFEQVDYVQLDGEQGLEMVVGHQVQNQVLRSLSVYDFSDEQPEKLMAANYQKYLTYDIDGDEQQEIVVLNPGRTETDNGTICVFSMTRDQIKQSAEVPLSQPLGQVKFIKTGFVSKDRRAVFISSGVDENTVTTDVFLMVDGELTNVALLDAKGTDTDSLKNEFLYPEDIDRDGIVELPEVIPMSASEPGRQDQQEYMVRWYTIDPEGKESTKLYTYHNYQEGWYMELDTQAALRISVVPEGSGQYSFELWNEDRTEISKLWTVFVLTGEERSALAAENHRFVLKKTDSVVYAAELEDAARLLGVNEDQVKVAFHLIQSDWKTGEL